MRNWKTLFIGLVFCGLFFSTVQARTTNERDWEALDSFLNSRPSKLSDEINIGGNVRLEYQFVTEKQDDTKLRGSGSPTIGGSAVPNSVFDVQADLFCEYESDMMLSKFLIRFKNDSGVVSGTRNNVLLENAWINMKLVRNDDVTINFGMGRQHLYDIFDSKVQFQDYFDGVLLHAAREIDWYGHIYFTGGSFMIDDIRDQYGWAVEGGWEGVCETGLYAKYSYIHWNRKGADQQWQFRNSQWLCGYEFQEGTLRLPKYSKIYTAYLINHEATRRAITNGRRKDRAWYIGFSTGKVEKATDMAFDINYQCVDPQAVRDGDVSGIGRGNINGNTFYSVTSPGRGDANFKGVQVNILYAIADRIVTNLNWELAGAEDRSVGGRQRYRKLELETTMAF